MNIFYLDNDLQKCVKYTIDKHVVKMCLETAQLLTTTIWVDTFLGFVPRSLTKTELGIINTEKAKQPSIEERSFTRYLPTHPNHPCAIWARASRDNYEWLFNYALHLGEEYTYRYDKVHASVAVTLRLPDAQRLESHGITKRPLSMPDEYKSECPVDSYRLYYMMDKARFAKWKNRPIPDWWDSYLVGENQCV